jgi:hypothetical protein
MIATITNTGEGIAWAGFWLAVAFAYSCSIFASVWNDKH